MRNFILGKTVAANNLPIASVPEGAVGFGFIDPEDGQLKTTTSSDNIAKKGYFILGRSIVHGGPVILPVYRHNFSYAFGEYTAATTFEATLTLPETIVEGEEYTVILVKKGVPFNERNKWTASVVAKESDTAETIGNKLAAYFMDGTVARYGVTVEVEDNVLTFTADTAGIPYTIIGADALIDAEIEIEKDLDDDDNVIGLSGAPAYGDVSYVRDLANKAAADAGFEYTYMDDVHYLYPEYPLNPLKNPDSSDTGFNILTFRFNEQREVKTLDDVVNQIIQVALPSGVDASALEDVCADLAEY